MTRPSPGECSSRPTLALSPAKAVLSAVLALASAGLWRRRPPLTWLFCQDGAISSSAAGALLMAAILRDWLDRADRQVAPLIFPATSRIDLSFFSPDFCGAFVVVKL